MTVIHATWPDAPKHFDFMSDAFDYCREANRPIRVCVSGEIWKLFPSGKATATGHNCPNEKASQ